MQRGRGGPLTGAGRAVSRAGGEASLLRWRRKPQHPAPWSGARAGVGLAPAGGSPRCSTIARTPLACFTARQHPPPASTPDAGEARPPRMSCAAAPRKSPGGVLSLLRSCLAPASGATLASSAPTWGRVTLLSSAPAWGNLVRSLGHRLTPPNLETFSKRKLPASLHALLLWSFSRSSAPELFAKQGPHELRWLIDGVLPGPGPASEPAWAALLAPAVSGEMLFRLCWRDFRRRWRRHCR